MIILLHLLSLFALIGTLLPFVPSEKWWIRWWDFPRAQLFTLMIALIFFYIVFGIIEDPISTILFFCLIASLIYQGVKIFPYTPLGRKEVLDVQKDRRGNEIRLMAANVLMDNRNAQPLLQQIEKNNPDIIFLVETDQWWVDSLKTLEGEYPYVFVYPKDNTYGLSFYSKFPMTETEVKFLVDQETPSLHTWIELGGSKRVKIYGMHPQPPAPEFHGNAHDGTKERDLELLRVGVEAKEIDAPIIVVGDLNDVAWSYTNWLFQKKSCLLDPRKGRGTLNTFHADYFFFRFPIDHIFLSSQFSVIELKRLGHIGSDHFPIFGSFYLTEK